MSLRVEACLVCTMPCVPSPHHMDPGVVPAKVSALKPHTQRKGVVARVICVSPVLTGWESLETGYSMVIPC